MVRICLGVHSDVVISVMLLSSSWLVAETVQANLGMAGQGNVTCIWKCRGKTVWEEGMGHAWFRTGYGTWLLRAFKMHHLTTHWELSHFCQPKPSTPSNIRGVGRVACSSLKICSMKWVQRHTLDPISNIYACLWILPISKKTKRAPE